MEAVETICPGGPAFSISGPKISTPEITDIRLTPSVQSTQRVVPTGRMARRRRHRRC